jgi:hypothetical protein
MPSASVVTHGLSLNPVTVYSPEMAETEIIGI